MLLQLESCAGFEGRVLKPESAGITASTPKALRLARLLLMLVVYLRHCIINGGVIMA